MGFIEDIAPLVQKYVKEYGICVVSPIVAQGILESQKGESELGKNAHNYFGLKYRPNRVSCSSGIYYKVGSEQRADGTYVSSDMQWYKFDTMSDGVKGYLQFINTPNYANLKGVTNPRTYLELIKKDGYATSLKYIDNLMAVIEKYDLTKYDNINVTENKDSEVDKVSYKLYNKLANTTNHGKNRSVSNIKFIVMHYTANANDTALANANYFQTGGRQASAHYFVDKTSIYQSVKDDVVAWSIGGSKYSDCDKTGGGKYYGVCTNANSISIELCSNNGAIAEETVGNAVVLVKDLMAKYHIPVENVIRHFDVTGKKCVGWTGWLPTTNESLWNNFKSRLGGVIKVEVEKPIKQIIELTPQQKINKQVQEWINHYLGTNILEDGKFGDISKKYLNMCLEKATGLKIANIDKIKFSMVKSNTNITKVLEAYLFVRGFNPQDFSGNYTDSVTNAVKEFQRTVFTLAKDIDGKCGSGTFKKIVF